jgi:type I restriction enzyme S subunit
VGGRFVEEGINYFKVESISDSGALEATRLAHIDGESDQLLQRSRLEAGDVLFSIAGAIGRTYLVKADDLPANVNQALAIVRFDPARVYPTYGYYAMRDGTFQAEASGRVVQCAQANVNLKQLSKSAIRVPPMNEQRGVADILSSYDDLIENNRRRMALLEQTARLLYQEWFVRLRFPGHEHTRIVNGVPEGWQRAKAFDAMQVMSGGTPKTTNPDYWDGDIPFYTPKDATETCFVLETERCITELGLKNCNSQLYPPDTTFISARGTVGKLSIAARPMAMSQSSYALRGKGYVSPLFLFCALREAVEQFRQQAVGAVFDAVIVDTFKLIPFLVPNKKFVRVFEETAEPMFAQIRNLLVQNQKLRAARDLLLPRLMSGEVSVGQLEGQLGQR